MVYFMLSCFGSFTEDSHPIYNAPMLGAHKLVQLIADPWGVSMNTGLTFHRSGTGPADSRAGRVPSLPIFAIHPPRQPAIPDEGRSE